MAFSIEVSGLEELESKLDELGAKAAHIAAEGLYEGAGYVADKVSRAVHGIATEPFKYARNGQKRKPSPEEKAILENARHGVAKFRNTGISVETSVGFQNSGYGNITWNHARAKNSRTLYKQGEGGRMVHASQGTGASAKPVPLIANSINSGTSFMEKQPFLRKAFSQGNGAAVAIIENEILKRLDEIEL